MWCFWWDSRNRRHALLAFERFWVFDRGYFRYVWLSSCGFQFISYCVAEERSNETLVCRLPIQFMSRAFLVTTQWHETHELFWKVVNIPIKNSFSMQEMLYGIQTGFGSPQVPVAELLARPAPTLLSPQNYRPKSSNFLQVPDIESRPKSVPSSPMVKRAFSRLGTITAGWGRSIRSQQQSQLSADDKKKWASSQDCSGKTLYGLWINWLWFIVGKCCIQQIKMARIVHPKINLMHFQQCLVSNLVIGNHAHSEIQLEFQSV